MNSENKLVIEQINKFGKVPQRHELLQMIERLEQENQKYKEVIDKIQKHCEIEINASNHYLEKHSSQKEFIEYMNKTIEELECDDVDDEEMKGYLIQRIDTFKEILSKYKEIIGSDINVGSIGDKDEIK